MKESVKKINLKTRVVIQMAILIILITTVFSLIFINRYYAYENEVLSQERIQNLYSLKASIDGVIANADNCSKMMVADYTVQTQMNTGDLNSSTSGQRLVINKAYSILPFSEGVESIWLIDGKGQRLIIGNTAGFSTGNDTDSYNEIKKRYGSANMYIERGPGNTSFSLVRPYINTSDFNIVGIIGVNLDVSYIDSLISKIMDNENEYLLIMDEKNNIIYWNGLDETAGEYINIACGQCSKETEIFKRILIGKKNYNMSAINDRESGWKYIRFTPMPIETPVIFRAYI